MAIISANPDFLFENAFRSFPFEDSISLDNWVSYSSVLDIKGFSRSPRTGKIKLTHITRWNTGSIQPSTPLVLREGYIQLFFSIPVLNLESIVISIDIPTDTNEWPIHKKAIISNANGYPYIMMSSIIGESITKDLPRTMIISLDEVYLEDTVVLDAYKRSIDQFKIIHSDSTESYMSGDVVIVNGLHSVASQNNNSISIKAGQNEGITQKDIPSDPSKEDYCNGIVAINGTSPSGLGEFNIVGGNGILIRNAPSINTIYIEIDQSSNAAKCDTIGSILDAP